MQPDMDMLKQVRKGLRDIRATLTDPYEHRRRDKAVYQVDCLWAMLELEPEQREPWSYYKARTEEEFDA